MVKDFAQYILLQISATQRSIQPISDRLISNFSSTMVKWHFLPSPSAALLPRSTILMLFFTFRLRETPSKSTSYLTNANFRFPYIAQTNFSLTAMLFSQNPSSFPNSQKAPFVLSSLTSNSNGATLPIQAMRVRIHRWVRNRQISRQIRRNMLHTMTKIFD